MTNSNPKSSRRSLLRIVAVFFLLCLAGLAFLGANALEQQVQTMIGLPEPSLGSRQIHYYELSFFVNQGRIFQKGRSVQDVEFSIESGQTIDQIIDGMAYQGVISDKGLFRDLLIYRGIDRQIMPGKYRIPAGSSMRDVLFILRDTQSILVDFVILPGWRIEEVAEALPTSGLAITPEDFLTTAVSPVMDPSVAGGEAITHEGFLFPGSYAFRRDVSLETFIGTFLNRFKQKITPDLREAYANHGLTVNQAVTLASIIQREAILDEEKPRIASVFLNRIKLGMKLETDPTVQYSLGYSPEWGWWKSPLSLQDLQVNSTYNTYIINGLPPTPISNPDEASLKAVAFPEETTFLYFRAACDGSGKHAFSETIEEHSMNGCQ
jgi:UPF0755 protein